MHKDIGCVILAAGEGTRMKLSTPKVLSEVLFEPMVGWVIGTVANCNIKNICIVTGFKKDIVQNYLNSLDVPCESVVQEERKGSAHAVVTALPFLEKFKGGDILVLSGDAPFMDRETIKKAYKIHKYSDNSATVISSKLENPFGYGRIIRNRFDFNLEAIVEEKDATFAQKEIKEVNSGAYWFKADDLLENLNSITNNTAQNEYYLTSLIKILAKKNLRVDAFEATSPYVALGANDLFELENLNEIARNIIIDKVISNGVYIPCRQSIMIGKNVKIGQDTTILPGTVIKGKTEIGCGCTIGPNSQVINCQIGNFTDIIQSYCQNQAVGDEVKLPPFSLVT